MRERALVLAALLAMHTLPAFATCEPPRASPDTVGFASELAAFTSLPAADREARAAAATALAHRWLNEYTASAGRRGHDLYSTLVWTFQRSWASRTFDIAFKQPVDLVSGAIADLEAALAQDPTQVTIRVAAGLLRGLAGDPRRCLDHLSRALWQLDGGAGDGLGDDRQARAERDRLRFTAAASMANACCELGLWDQFDALAATYAPVQGHRLWPLLNGLALAGRGLTSQALAWATQMPPIAYPHASALSTGMEARPGSFGNDWIRSQALLAAGDLAGARAVIGDIDRWRYHRLPLGEQFWQDAGLIVELAGEPLAAECYRRGRMQATLWFARLSDGATLGPLVLRFPDPAVPFFTGAGGEFVGGSPFGYVAQQMNLMAAATDTTDFEAARRRALVRCDALLRRGIQPDVVRAFRARVHIAAGCPELARPDLEFAHAAFAGRGLVDAGTSLLLGQQELLADRVERAATLLGEAAAAAPGDALAWQGLGAALARGRDLERAEAAMRRSLALDPASAEGWYNLGLLLYHEDDLDAATTCLEKAWELEPDTGQVQQVLQAIASERRAIKALR